MPRIKTPDYSDEPPRERGEHDIALDGALEELRLAKKSNDAERVAMAWGALAAAMGGFGTPEEEAVADRAFEVGLAAFKTKYPEKFPPPVANVREAESVRLPKWWKKAYAKYDFANKYMADETDKRLKAAIYRTKYRAENADKVKAQAKASGVKRLKELAPGKIAAYEVELAALITREVEVRATLDSLAARWDKASHRLPPVGYTEAVAELITSTKRLGVVRKSLGKLRRRLQAPA